MLDGLNTEYTDMLSFCQLYFSLDRVFVDTDTEKATQKSIIQIELELCSKDNPKYILDLNWAQTLSEVLISLTAFKKSGEAVPEKNLLLLAGAPMLLLFWSESLLRSDRWNSDKIWPSYLAMGKIMRIWFVCMRREPTCSFPKCSRWHWHSGF